MLILLLACANPSDDTALPYSEGGWVEILPETYESESRSYWLASAPDGMVGPAPVELWVKVDDAWENTNRTVSWEYGGTRLLALKNEDDQDAVYYVWMDAE